MQMSEIKFLPTKNDYKKQNLKAKILFLKMEL